MSTQKALTFKCSSAFQQAIQEIMEERQLDRTSVIRLALYMFVAYMSQEKTHQLDLHELVKDIEQQAPPSYPSYSSFCK